MKRRSIVRHECCVNSLSELVVSTAEANSEQRAFCMLPSTHAMAAPHVRATHPATYASVSSKSRKPLPAKSGVSV